MTVTPERTLSPSTFVACPMCTPVILVLVYAIRIVMREDIPGTSRIEFFGPVGNWPGEYPKSLMRSCVWDNDTMVRGFVSLDVPKLGMIDFTSLSWKTNLLPCARTHLGRVFAYREPHSGDQCTPAAFAGPIRKAYHEKQRSNHHHCIVQSRSTQVKRLHFPSITIAFGVFAPITHFRGI